MMKQQKKINKLIMEIYKYVHENEEKLSCFECKTPYCCHNKIKIDMVEDEFKTLKNLATKKHKEQAKKSIIQQASTGRYSCPFLDEHDKCSVYHYRPMACSIYMVTTPPEACQDPQGDSAKVNPDFIFSHLPQKFLLNISKQRRYDLLDIFKN